MNEWPLGQCKIVGVKTTWTGAASFDRAPIVLKSVGSGGDRLVVHCIVEQTVFGNLVTPGEWAALVAVGHAMEVSDAPEPEPGLWFWVFRASFPLPEKDVRRELEDGNHVAGRWLKGKNDAYGCFVRDDSAAALRTVWADQLIKDVQERISKQQWDLAWAAAHAAFVVEPLESPRCAAMLIVVLRLRGDLDGADDYSEMLAGSMGQPFGDEMKRQAVELEKRFAPTRLNDMRQRRQNYLCSPPELNAGEGQRQAA